MSDRLFIRAAFTATLAALMFASMGVTIRIASTELSNEMVVFLRSAFGLLVLFPWLCRKGLKNLATKRPAAHILRALSGLAAMYCFFYAIAHLQLAEAILLNYCSPLFIAVIALLWLGEKITKLIIAAIIIGFLGICLILKPGFGTFSYAAWIGLVSAIFAAIAMVAIRNLSSTEPTYRTVFYYSLTATIVSAIPMIWSWQNPGWNILGIMVFAGLFATLGQFLLTYSYSLVPAAEVSPYSYSTVIFAAVYGWIIWSEVPDTYMYIGAVLVIIAGIMAKQSSSMPQLTEPD